MAAMSELTGRTAAEEYAVHVARRDRGRLARAAHRLWGLGATLVNGAVSDGVLPYPETGEIVVTDQEGAVALRLPVNPDTTGPTLAQVEADLAVLSAEDFLTQWRGTP